jgi:polysaccharide biosynthesis/export protein
VSVDGAVNRPGRYELIGARDLAELVQAAGGLAATATQHLPVSLVRRLPDDRQDQQLLPFADGQLPASKLQHDDSVHIPDYVELQRSVMVVGAIKGVTPPSAAAGTTPDEATSTRRLAFVEGDSVRTLLERVGGVGPLADLTGSYVLRSGKSLPVDLYSLVMLRDLKVDRPVALGDTLVIPFKRRNILVQGAVFTPGSYPYNPTFGIEQYLALAGGRNRFAQSLSDVRVITPDGETRKFKRDLAIEPGSSLVVPERNFSRSEVVQIVLGAAGVLVSGVAVVLASQR